MKKNVFTYGIALALLVFVLEVIEYKVLMREITAEFYITVLAILFLGLGMWLGKKLTTPKKSSPIFIKNTKALEYLAISDRELEVLELVARGLSNQQIADTLYVSVNTVKTHLSRVYEKLEVKRRTQAVEKAKSLQLIE